MLLRPKISASDTLWFSLIAGLTAQDAISRAIGVECDLRWPNDILLGTKKLGGILTELSAEGDAVRHLVIGIGLNVNQSAFPPEIAEEATSLRIETDREWSRLEILRGAAAGFRRSQAVRGPAV